MNLIYTTTRNKAVKADLEDVYNDPDTSLAISTFCVSSHVYQKLTCGSQRERGALFMGIMDTEIPQLQYCLMELPAQRRNAEWENFVHAAGTLFEDAETWLNRDKSEGALDVASKAALRRGFHKAYRRFKVVRTPR